MSANALRMRRLLHVRSLMESQSEAKEQRLAAAVGEAKLAATRWRDVVANASVSTAIAEDGVADWRTRDAVRALAARRCEAALMLANEREVQRLDAAVELRRARVAREQINVLVLELSASEESERQRREQRTHDEIHLQSLRRKAQL